MSDPPRTLPDVAPELSPAPETAFTPRIPAEVDGAGITEVTPDQGRAPTLDTPPAQAPDPTPQGFCE